MKNLKKILVLCSLALVLTLAFSDAAFAAAGSSNSDLMNLAGNKALALFNRVKMIIFIVGGFGLVGIAFQAIFGKVKWTWFAGLAVGLAILAAAGAIVNYATGDTVGNGTNASTNDTFDKSATGTINAH